MLSEGFHVTIPEGEERADGHVTLEYGAPYTLILDNCTPDHCDAEVYIDGEQVGTWRVGRRRRVHVEGGMPNRKPFTFARSGSVEAGAVSVVFKPGSDPRENHRAAPNTAHRDKHHRHGAEEPRINTYLEFYPDPRFMAGWREDTKRSGRPREASELVYDLGDDVTIQLCLIGFAKPGI